MDESIWRITPEDRQNYQKVFTFFDKNQAGTLSDDEMKTIMQQT